MLKKKSKAAAPAAGKEAAPAPKKRSKLKIILLAVMPLVGAGGGYAGWVFYAGASSAEAAHGEAAGGEGGEHGQDEGHIAAIPPEVAAETSATYSFALSELLKTQCGAVGAEALKAASEAEAKADGTLVNLSWMAALRRVGSITQKSCNRILVEIDMAEAKAARRAAGKDEEEKSAHH